MKGLKTTPHPQKKKKKKEEEEEVFNTKKTQILVA